jgi:alpha-beta hydrolase superfamily lysophospholipase
MNYLIKLDDGTVLNGIISRPEENAEAAVILVHGLGEHIGRYSAWAGDLKQEGIGITGVDLPGHGYSGGRRGDIRGIEVIDEIIGRLLVKAVKTFQDTPLFLYGHSLGGCLVLDYILRNEPGIAGAIVTSPWLKLTKAPARAKLLLAAAVRRVYPGLRQPSGLNAAHLSRDQGVVEKYMTDPLVHDRISVRLFHMATMAASRALAGAHRLKIPLLLMHGSDDLICSPAGSREFASMTPMAELEIWNGGYHELHNEFFRQDVFKYITRWINTRIDRHVL